ncbi:MAG: hypothetical protein FWC64_07000 [Treponema sp.]|nr:hypothetical protein [Treponema sp.]
MAKKKTDENETENTVDETITDEPGADEAKNDNPKKAKGPTGKVVKAKFRNTYIGKFGSFQHGRVYELSADVYGALKADCEAVE